MMVPEPTNLGTCMSLNSLVNPALGPGPLEMCVGSTSRTYSIHST